MADRVAVSTHSAPAASAADASIATISACAMGLRMNTPCTIRSKMHVVDIARPAGEQAFVLFTATGDCNAAFMTQNLIEHIFQKNSREMTAKFPVRLQITQRFSTGKFATNEFGDRVA